MSVPVTIGSEVLKLNFELQCDAFSGAFVGISIRDNEDSTAVIESFRQGIETTGAAPLAELLDNKPSNHTPEVDAALGDTIRMRATVQRPQNKAHVEGAFGLFSTSAPPLELDLGAGARQITYNLRALARRKVTTGATLVGLVLVIFVLTSVLMLAAGIQNTLASTGNAMNVKVLRKSVNNEGQSWVTGDQVQLLAAAEQVARNADGKPLLSPELMVFDLGAPRG